MNKVIVFLPCRQGSQRVKSKNIKTFAGVKGGLTYLKLSQLLNVEAIEQIIVSTNDEEVKRIAESFENSKIVIDDRPKDLASSITSTDDLIKYVPSIIKSGTVLWTHVTSPFITSDLYEDIIQEYFVALEKGYDSLMTVSLIHGFLWDENKAINYDRSLEKWPRTQTIKPLYEINSGVFINSIENYTRLSDRIGERPFLRVLDKITGFDIDWEEDFLMGECIMNSGIGKV